MSINKYSRAKLDKIIDDKVAAGGLDCSTCDGDDLIVAVGNVGIGTTSPKTSLDVIHDYNTTTFENQLSDGEGGGRVLRYSPGADDTLTAGQIYFLHTDGTWNSAVGDAVATGGSQLLGVGLGGSARTVGVLLEGFIRIPSTEILNTPGSGAVDGLPLYISTTTGHFDFTAPSATGDIVRVVGYAIDDDSSDVLVYFDPDKTWVEIAQRDDLTNGILSKQDLRMIKDICYRVSDGLILAVKQQGSVWSNLEIGNFDGATLKMIEIALTSVEYNAFRAGMVTENNTDYDCRLYYLNEVLSIVKENS